MARLIEGILRYAEIGHGDRSVERVDANALVAEVIEPMAPPPHAGTFCRNRNHSGRGRSSRFFLTWGE